jgi:drug/metabolite transporter (DMT)-like permease
MSSPVPAPASRAAVVLALLLVYVVWGSTYLAIRFALEGGALPLTMVSGTRFIVAGTLLYAVLRWRGVPAPHGLAAVAYLCVFGSIVAFTAYVWLLHHVRPALAGSYAYVNPVIAVALGAWLAHERFTAHDLGAMAVILAGVAVVTLAKARK